MSSDPNDPLSPASSRGTSDPFNPAQHHEALGENSSTAMDLADNRSGRRLTVFSPLFVAFGVVILAVSMGLVAPVHPFESFLYAMMWTSPLVAVTIFAFLEPIRKFGQKINRPRSIWIYCTLAASLVMTCVMLIGNVMLDKSIAETHTYTVVSTTYTTHKGSHTYYIEILSPTPSPLSFSVSDDEKISSSYDEYIRAVPHQTLITLKMHAGFFNLPWYERHHTLSNTGNPRSTVGHGFISVPRTDPMSAQVTDACLWHKNFDAVREIEAITPDAYHRDFWPGGQPRSVEPQVNGQTHGIGHYTFANGAVYGDIPWKHGQKHGWFVLHREDGSIEQILSYKDGHPYGINEWFKPDGTLQVKWLYLSEKSYLPVSACDSTGAQ